jgi:hypothetical protein
MPKFGTRSEEVLATIHPDLIKVLRTAIQIKDFAVVEGFRSEEDQHKAFLAGNSKIDWHSGGKHTKEPAEAVDIRPWDLIDYRPVDWLKAEEYILLAGVVIACAELLDIKIRWGHDWNRNVFMLDEIGKLVDMPHFELVG